MRVIIYSLALALAFANSANAAPTKGTEPAKPGGETVGRTETRRATIELGAGAGARSATATRVGKIVREGNLANKSLLDSLKGEALDRVSLNIEKLVSQSQAAKKEGKEDISVLLRRQAEIELFNEVNDAAGRVEKNEGGYLEQIVNRDVDAQSKQIAQRLPKMIQKAIAEGWSAETITNYRVLVDAYVLNLMSTKSVTESLRLAIEKTNKEQKLRLDLRKLLESCEG